MSNALVPVVRVVDGAVYANSREVSDYFGKEHKHAMRDIRAIRSKIGPKGHEWFTPSTYQARVGFGLKTLPAFNMTKDGFALLVMGFTGKAALGFKVRYIETFNEMERVLRSGREKPRYEVPRHQPHGPSRVLIRATGAASYA